MKLIQFKEERWISGCTQLWWWPIPGMVPLAVVLCALWATSWNDWNSNTMLTYFKVSDMPASIAVKLCQSLWVRCFCNFAVWCSGFWTFAVLFISQFCRFSGCCDGFFFYICSCWKRLPLKKYLPRYILLYHLYRPFFLTVFPETLTTVYQDMIYCHITAVMLRNLNLVNHTITLFVLASTQQCKPLLTFCYRLLIFLWIF